VSGEITALDGATGQITLKPRFRDAITVETSGETEFLRKVFEDGLEPITFDDLQQGDRVTVAGTWDGDVLRAQRVTVKPEQLPPPATIHGAISSLNSGDGTLMVAPLTGDAVLVQTSEGTEFYRETQRARREPITFADLADGDWVRVQGDWVEEVFDAVRVTVMPFQPAPPPRLLMGSIGELLSVSDFTLEHQRQDPITVKTTETTKFFRTLRWGRLELISFDDLAADDWVAVLGHWDGEALIAHVVTVMRGHGDEVEGVLEIGGGLETGELVEGVDTLQVQP
jgi:hypothetical protein